MKARISKEVVCTAGQEILKKMLQFILKSYVIILMVLLFISIFFGPCLKACGILVPQSGTKATSALEAWGLNLCITREVLGLELKA